MEESLNNGQDLATINSNQNSQISNTATHTDDLAPQQTMEKPCGCGGNMEKRLSLDASPSYIYAIGRIYARPPNHSIKQEIAQISGRTHTKGLIDDEATQKIISAQENRYLARKMCWIMEVEGIPMYILRPRDSYDLDLLIETVRSAPNRGTDMDLVIGSAGPLATPEKCNGLILPIVLIDQIYSFDRNKLIESIPKPEKVSVTEFEKTAGEILDKVQQMADNAGRTNEHRALNYLVVRHEDIYAKTAEMHAKDFSLTAIEVRPSRLTVAGTRVVLDVIFTYTQRTEPIGYSEKYFMRVDVTEEFPFLRPPAWAPYYDR
jgi:PatG C-terminal